MDSYKSNDNCAVQIGQWLIIGDLQRTKEFYSQLPKITDNCKCGDCEHYEKNVINEQNRLFDILRRMNVDLSKQPKINPDGICCIGEVELGKLGYIGYYFIYGNIFKTSEETSLIDSNENIEEIEFDEKEFEIGISLTITKADNEKLSFRFYMEADL